MTRQNIFVPRYENDYRPPLVDMRFGGSGGLLPTPSDFASNAIYVQQQLMAFLVAPPALFAYADDPQKELDDLKAMIELMPIKIDGLDSTVSNEHGAELPIGNAGEKLQAITKSSRAVSAPSFGYGPDRMHQSITRYWTEYSRQYIMDPDIQKPAIIQNPNYTNAGSPPITPTDCGFIVLFVESDPTLTRPLKAWLVGNMQPTNDIGELKGYKELGASGQTVDVNIACTAYTQIGQAVYMLAQEILNAINLSNLRPYELAGIVSDFDGRVKDSRVGVVPNVSNRSGNVIPEVSPNLGS